MDKILMALGLKETVRGKPEPLEGVKDGAVWAGVSGSTVEPGLKYNPQLTVQAQLDLWEKQATEQKDKDKITAAREAKGKMKSSGEVLLASLKAKAEGKNAAKKAAEYKKTLKADTKALAKILAPLIKKFGVTEDSECGCNRKGGVPTVGDGPTLSKNLIDGRCGDTDTQAISDVPQAHHIVPGGANLSKPDIVSAKKKLAAPPVCIGSNGVFLPKTSKSSFNEKPKRTFHNCTFRGITTHGLPEKSTASLTIEPP